MRKYPLQNLSNQEFEKLITVICNKILGTAIVPFAEGRDGGRDGFFNGKANKIPSEQEPWDGKIVIQAKHTNKDNASCSDSDFSTIIKGEIPKIQKLKNNSEIDYYLLFTNRRLPAGIESQLRRQIENATQIPTIIFGDEKIQHFIHEYPDIVRTAKLNDLLLPFQFDDSDIKEIIEILSTTIKTNTQINTVLTFSYPGIERKNEINKLSTSYFEDSIKRNYEDFSRITDFLSQPINSSIKDLYNDATSEINAKITLHRDDFVEFENILENFYDLVVSNNQDSLKYKKRLVRTLLHYMYCNCDIGKKE